MAIKITGDNLQYGDTAIATLTNTNFNLASGKIFSTDHLTASTLVVNDSANFSGHVTASHGMRIFDGLTLAALNNNPADLMFTNVGSMECLGSANFNIASFNVSADFIAGTVVTAAGKVTASNGMEITNHMTMDDGIITVSGRFGSDLIPSTDSARDLGTSTLQWAEAHVDHGYIDDITATGTSTLTTVDINGGAIDGTTIGASSAAAVTATTVTATAVTASMMSVTDGATFAGQLTASAGLRVGSGGSLSCLGDSQFTGLLTVFGDMAIGQNGQSDEVTIYSTFSTNLVPTLDSSVNLGTSTKQWAEAHVDHGYIDDITATGTSNLATVNVTGQLTASNGLAVSGDVSFEDASFSGDVTLGNAVTDVTTVNGHLTASSGIKTNGSAWFNSQTWIGSPFMSTEHANQHKLDVYAAINTDLIPSADSSKDLGSSSRQWAEAHIDTGHIDTVTAVNVDGILGANSAAAATVTTLVTNGTMTLVGAANLNGDLTLESDHDAKARSFITYSDATLKQDIKPLDSALDKVMSMRGVSYEFKNQASADGATHREVGFLAQEMKQAVPEVVYGNGDGNLGIDYAKLTSVLVEAVKAQQTQIEQQQSQIDELKESLLKNK